MENNHAQRSGGMRSWLQERAVPRYVFFTMLAVMMTVTLTDTASRHAWKPVLIGMTGAAIVVAWAAWRARHAK